MTARRDRLRPVDADEARRLYGAGDWTARALARRYHVTQLAVRSALGAAVRPDDGAPLPYEQQLAAWARAHGLRRSRREACGHGVLGVRPDGPDHDAACVGDRLALLDHATIWTYRGGRVLLAHPFRPRPHEPEAPAYRERVARYARALGLTYLLPQHRPVIYHAEATAVLYGPPRFDLSPLAPPPVQPHEGVRRSARRAVR